MRPVWTRLESSDGHPRWLHHCSEGPTLTVEREHLGFYGKAVFRKHVPAELKRHEGHGCLLCGGVPDDIHVPERRLPRPAREARPAGPELPGAAVVARSPSGRGSRFRLADGTEVGIQRYKRLLREHRSPRAIPARPRAAGAA